MPNSDIPFSTKLPEELLRRLDQQHDLTHVPKRKMVELALDQYLPPLKGKKS